jgi:hypothetical protein
MYPSTYMSQAVFPITLRHGIFLLSGGNMLCCNGNRNSNNVPKSAIRLCPDAFEFSRHFETLFLQYICNITFPHLAIVYFLEFYRVNIVYIVVGIFAAFSKPLRLESNGKVSLNNPTRRRVPLRWIAQN